MIGEIYRYLRGIKIYGGDGMEESMYCCVIKILDISFFHFFLCPVEVIEIDEESRNISLIVVLHVVIGAVVVQGQIILVSAFGVSSICHVDV